MRLEPLIQFVVLRIALFSMASRSLLEAQRAQHDGRGYLASMIVDLEAQVEGERFSKAKAFKDNGLLASEARAPRCHLYIITAHCAVPS